MLDPCPFCGGGAEIERLGSGRQSMIYVCTQCGARLETGETFISEHCSWNARSGSQGVVTEEVANAVIQAVMAHGEIEDGVLVACDIAPVRAALLAVMGGKQSDKLSIAPTGIAFHNSTSAPPPATISEDATCSNCDRPTSGDNNLCDRCACPTCGMLNPTHHMCTQPCQ